MVRKRAKIVTAGYQARQCERTKNVSKVSVQRKLEVWERDGWRCRYCGCEVIRIEHVDGERRPPDAATVDHVHPRRYGGSNRPENLVTACEVCNNRKADQSIGDFGIVQLQPTLAEVWPELDENEKAMLG
jgi:5-methylcytosine-specific restriction endonuclease McrA